MIVQKFWTYELAGDILYIDDSFGLTSLSILLVSGTATVQGGITLTNGLISSPLNLTIGQPLNLPSNANLLISDLIIDAGVGQVYLIGIQ